MPNDPIRTYYTKGYEDAKTGRRSRVPYNFKLAYANGRYDFVTGKSSRYEQS